MTVYELIYALCGENANADVTISFVPSENVEAECPHCDGDLSIEVPTMSATDIDISGNSRYVRIEVKQ